MTGFGCCFVICASSGYLRRDGPMQSSLGHSLLLHASMKNKGHQNDKLIGEKKCHYPGSKCFGQHTYSVRVQGTPQCSERLWNPGRIFQQESLIICIICSWKCFIHNYLHWISFFLWWKRKATFCCELHKHKSHPHWRNSCIHSSHTKTSEP